MAKVARHHLGILLGAFFIGAEEAAAQDSAVPRQAEALRIAAEDAPEIDGFLDEGIWSRAKPIGELVQIEPRAGARPSEATDVRILYTSRALYLGVKCYDSNPSGIRATQMERDAVLDPDDRIEMLFDTFHDRRNAFWFQIAPRGGKGDALISSNGRRFNKRWDTIWHGRSRITDEGWVAEIAIPFSSISFSDTNTSWGFNIRRFIRRRNEVVRWAAPDRDFNFFRISEAGVIRGLEGMQQGIGLDVIPGVVGTYRRLEATGDEDLNLEPTLDVRYRITPSLAATLTFNTDFAETEVDDRRVNLTRFPLFFPEKREFFLEDSSIFEFGGRGNQSNIPFFSRRIGLSSDGEMIPLRAGAKLAGRHGEWNIGMLAAHTGSRHEIEDQNLAVARISRNIFESSEVGLIATHGDPEGDSHNTVVGADFRLNTSELIQGKSLVFEGFLLGSFDSDPDKEGSSYGLRLDYPNDLIAAGLGFEAIQESYTPALGFVRRRGTKQLSGSFEFKPRPGGGVIRQYEFGISGSTYLDTGNSLETAGVVVTPLQIEFESADRIRTEVEWSREILDEDFEISDGVTIPSGDYSYSRARLVLSSSDHRPLSGSVSFDIGEFFDGDRVSVGGALAWRPSSLVELSTDYTENFVDLPGGEFTTRVASGRLRMQFSPEVSWTTTLQWDNGSDILGLNSRLRWILEPGSDLFLVVNQNIEDPSGRFRQSDGDLSIKVEYTFRF